MGRLRRRAYLSDVRACHCVLGTFANSSRQIVVTLCHFKAAALSNVNYVNLERARVPRYGKFIHSLEIDKPKMDQMANDTLTMM